MTRERRYQLRNLQKGLCRKCPRARIDTQHCVIHALKQYEYDRRFNTKRVRPGR